MTRFTSTLFEKSLTSLIVRTKKQIFVKSSDMNVDVFRNREILLSSDSDDSNCIFDDDKLSCSDDGESVDMEDVYSESDSDIESLGSDAEEEYKEIDGAIENTEQGDEAVFEYESSDDDCVITKTNSALRRPHSPPLRPAALAPGRATFPTASFQQLVTDSYEFAKDPTQDSAAHVALQRRIFGLTRELVLKNDAWTTVTRFMVMCMLHSQAAILVPPTSFEVEGTACHSALKRVSRSSAVPKEDLVVIDILINSHGLIGESVEKLMRTPAGERTESVKDISQRICQTCVDARKQFIQQHKRLKLSAGQQCYIKGSDTVPYTFYLEDGDVFRVPKAPYVARFGVHGDQLETLKQIHRFVTFSTHQKRLAEAQASPDTNYSDFCEAYETMKRTFKL